MKQLVCLVLLISTTTISLLAQAQVPEPASNNQALLLLNANPQLAANKKLVYDFWRTIIEAGHLDLAKQYLSKDYIQHNPTVPTGRAGFVKFFSQFSKASPIKDHIQAPLISIVADGNLVVLSFVRQLADPTDKTKTYNTTWFDMFRVEHGKIVEHWDSALKH